MAFNPDEQRKKHWANQLSPGRGDHKLPSQNELKPEPYLENGSHRKLAPCKTLGRITTNDKRVPVRVRVKTLVDPTPDQAEANMSQRGVLQDAANPEETISFKSWASDSPPSLEEGAVYEITGARVDSFNRRPELVIDSRTSVERL